MVIEINPSNNSEVKALLNIEELSLFVSNRLLLTDFTLRLNPGERIALTGPSGCGKTTLLRTVVGRRLLGASTADYFDVTPNPIGYVPQHGELLPWYSVQRNLETFARNQTDNKTALCKDVLKEMDLTHVKALFPEQLSGGELQRARLAAATIVNPMLCCADEPLTEVGLSQRWHILERWSLKMKKYRTALLLVSHDVDTLMYLCDAVIVLGGPSGSPAKILGRLTISGGQHPRPLHEPATPARLLERQQLMRYLQCHLA